MTHDSRWQRIESIFHALADEPAGRDRDASMLTLCDGDAGLAAEVAALLAEDERLHTAEAPPDPHVGLRLGSYQVDRLIARGGMAAVYEAHRADDQFRQRVAVKIMDLRLSDPALVAQFRSERQILAALEHPRLTRLLDGGVTALGEPYLVMEFVEGEPIDRFCDRQRLDIAARVRLFAQVCDGVAFAHRNLILHRDLKPSNILVSGDGQAKVVDFGTATLLEPERLATVSRAPLTPAYASPEQLTGQPVGTPSDQYSLGLVLYQLLSGTAPFGDRPSLMAAMERALARTATTAPHAVVTAAAADARATSLARLRRVLAGDLGTIVGKALAHEPMSRYASVEHLANDLARWTRGEPILAHPPSVAYRASRFVRRHWVATAVAAALAVALVGATVVSVQQARVARAQEARARIESDKAQQLNRFLTQMLSSANPSWYNASGGDAGSITVRQVLDGAGSLIERELGAAPEVEAEMQRTLGRTYLGLGLTDQAGPHLERALALYSDQENEAGRAFTRMLLGTYHLYRGEYETSESRLREALAYVRTQGPAADPELHTITTNDLALAIAGQRQAADEVIALMRESVSITDRSGLHAGAAGIAMANIGTELLKVGRVDDAEVAMRDALRRMAALPAAPPERYGLLANLSALLLIRGNAVEAERLGAEAAEGAARTWPADHPYQVWIRATWARALVAAGHVERGHAVLAAAHDVNLRVRPPGHPDLSRTLVGLGEVYRLQGRYRDAEHVLREALKLLDGHEPLVRRQAEAAGELGLTLRARGDVAEADALLRSSHDTLQALYGSDHPLTKQALERIGAAAGTAAPSSK